MKRFFSSIGFFALVLLFCLVHVGPQWGLLAFVGMTGFTAIDYFGGRYFRRKQAEQHEAEALLYKAPESLKPLSFIDQGRN